MAQRPGQRPKELQDLDATIGTLRDVQRVSPDIADYLQAAVDRAASKRRELEAQQPTARQAAMLSIISKAAELYRRQIN